MTGTYYREHAGDRWLLQPTRQLPAEATPSPAGLAAKANEDRYSSARGYAVIMLERAVRALHDISRFDDDGFGVDAAERFYVVRENLDDALGKFDSALNRLIPDVVPGRTAADQTPSESAADVGSDVQDVDLDRPESPGSQPAEVHPETTARTLTHEEHEDLLGQLQASVDRARGPRPGPHNHAAVGS